LLTQLLEGCHHGGLPRGQELHNPKLSSASDNIVTARLVMWNHAICAGLHPTQRQRC